MGSPVGKNLLAIFISHIWKQTEKNMESSEKNQVNFHSGFIFYLETNLSVFTFFVENSYDVLVLLRSVCVFFSNQTSPPSGHSGRSNPSLCGGTNVKVYSLFWVWSSLYSAPLEVSSRNSLIHLGGAQLVPNQPPPIQ